MNQTRARCLRLLFTTLVLGLMTGCGNHPPLVTVRLDESLRDKATGQMHSLQVDVIPIRNSDKGQWEGMSVADWFRPGTPTNDRKQNMLKSNHLIELNFTDGAAERKASDSSPAYAELKDDHSALMWEWSICVISNLPGTFDVKSESQDPRKLIIPLDETSLKHGCELNVTVHSAGYYLDKK